MSRFSKLKELRDKTDKQLIQLIDNKLDIGIRLARKMLNSGDRWTPSVQVSYFKAEQAHAEASRLMRLIYEAAGNKLKQLEARREQLQEMVEALEPVGSTPHKDKIAVPGQMEVPRASEPVLVAPKEVRWLCRQRVACSMDR
ncbi:MAG: hypothetical protein ABI833_02490 [Acidobacteriota bacterium]